MRPAPVLALLLAAACAPFPDLSDRIGPEAAAAPYPTLQPLQPLLAQADASASAPPDTAGTLARAEDLRARAVPAPSVAPDLDARAAALRARAEALRAEAGAALN